MRGCNLKWSVYSSIEGLVSREGLLHIRRGLSSHYTWIFKDKLGLFHLKSQRSRSRPPYPCSCLTALSPNPDLSHLIALLLLPSPYLFILSVILFYTFKFGFSITSHACPSSILFVVPQSSEAAEADEGMSTCLFPLSFCPAQPARCQCAEEIEMR